MNTITLTLARRIRLICALSTLGLMIASCGQPQTSATTASSPVAAANTSAMSPVAEMMSPAAEMATAMPMPTATPPMTATAMSSAAPEASMAAHDHMTSAAPEASMAAHDHMTSAAPVAAQPGGAETMATIKLFMFSPEPLEVKAGATVIWTNQDDIEHSITSGAAPTADGAFDSDLFAKDQTYTFTFSEPGEYSYFCKRHPSMVGTVKVTQ